VYFLFSSFSLRKENEAKPARKNEFFHSGGEAATGKKMKILSCRTKPTRTKADKTSFRAARGQANAQGEF
jgi:hypothetical protein